jgi:hypothetical protein
LRKPVLVAVPVLAVPAVAAADTLAGGPISVGNNQPIGGCSLFNAGTAAVALASFQIAAANGQPIALAQSPSPCSASLAAGRSCYILGGASQNVTSACTATTTVAGAGAFLRGALQLARSPTSRW